MKVARFLGLFLGIYCSAVRVKNAETVPPEKCLFYLQRRRRGATLSAEKQEVNNTLDLVPTVFLDSGN